MCLSVSAISLVILCMYVTACVVAIVTSCVASCNVPLAATLKCMVLLEHTSPGHAGESCCTKVCVTVR